MRYSQEFKIKCIEAYRQGQCPKTSKEIKQHNFRCIVERWSRMEQVNNSDVLNHKDFNKNWTPEEKFELVSQVLVRNPIQATAIKADIHDGMLYQWVSKYKTDGYNGFVDKKKGRKSKNQDMKKRNITDPRKLEESEYEKRIRIRAEKKYIKAEIEVIKRNCFERRKAG